jgi:hypothetical protein
MSVKSPLQTVPDLEEGGKELAQVVELVDTLS